MITQVHTTPEGMPIAEGINLWTGDNAYTKFRLIYRSLNTNWYFRIRYPEPFDKGTPMYIFSWEL